MGIETIGTGLKTVIDTIDGLKVSALNELPNKIHPPHAVILLGETLYNKAFGDSPRDTDLVLRLIILLGDQDNPSAANRMLNYIEASSSSSIVGKVEGDPTLDGSCDTSWVIRNLGLGVTNWGGMPYLSTEFEIAIFYND